MAEVKITLEQLERAVERMQNSVEYYGMSDKLIVRTCEGDGGLYVKFEQQSGIPGGKPACEWLCQGEPL